MKSRGIGDLNGFLEAPSWGDTGGWAPGPSVSDVGLDRTCALL